MRMFLLVLLLCPLLPAVAAGAVLIDDFEGELSPSWQKKIFRGETSYHVVSEGDGRILCAESAGSASGLFMEKEIDLRQTPILTWRWRADNVLERGDARSKAGDDYPARIYVIFPHWAFWKTRTLNYIWANRLERGEVVPNSFTANAMMFAVESGTENIGRWLTERRNVYEDFKRAFGEDPPKAGAIAIMTDTDNTGGSASACYDDIRFEMP